MAGDCLLSLYINRLGFYLETALDPGDKKINDSVLRVLNSYRYIVIHLLFFNVFILTVCLWDRATKSYLSQRCGIKPQKTLSNLTKAAQDVVAE